MIAEPVGRPVYPPTPRHVAADLVAAWLHKNKLSSSPVSLREETGKYYRCDFSAAGIWGHVRVYGPDYVMLIYEAGPGGLPRYDNRLYGSPGEAIAFLALAVLAGQIDAALMLPLRVPKAERKAKRAP